jgi:hypothetical protein
MIVESAGDVDPVWAALIRVLVGAGAADQDQASAHLLCATVQRPANRRIQM